MSDYGEYRLKSAAITASTHANAKLLLHRLLDLHILEIHLADSTVLTCTTNFKIAGEQPVFNTDKVIYVYDVNEHEWTTFNFVDVESMDLVAQTT